MSDREYKLAKKSYIERMCSEHFGVDLRVTSVVASDVDTQLNSYTTVFKTGATMYALCETDQPVTLLDIKSLIRFMGMEAEFYHPPAQDTAYFERYGKKAYLSTFPGREIVTDEDLKFYQTLAPYSPALVRISKVNGEIRRFNAKGNAWQTIMNLSYSRMRVQ